MSNEEKSLSKVVINWVMEKDKHIFLFKQEITIKDYTMENFK